MPFHSPCSCLAVFESFLPPGPADLEAVCLVAGDALPLALRARGENYFRLYYTVSRVAFSADRGLALLKYTRHCAPVSGAGEFFLALRLEEGQWRIIGGVPVSGGG